MIQVTILHAPFSAERRAMLVRLKRQLGDVFPVRVVKDVSQKGCMALYVAAHTLSTAESYHLLLEDDSFLHPSFNELILRFVAIAGPQTALGLWTTKEKPALQKAWIRGYGLCGGVAWCFPANWDAGIARWLRVCWKAGLSGPDTLRDLWLRANALEVLCPNPTIVAHGVPGKKHGSLLGHNYSAWYKNRSFLNDSPENVDWRAGFLNALDYKEPYLDKVESQLPTNLRKLLNTWVCG